MGELLLRLSTIGGIVKPIERTTENDRSASTRDPTSELNLQVSGAPARCGLPDQTLPYGRVKLSAEWHGTPLYHKLLQLVLVLVMKRVRNGLKNGNGSCNRMPFGLQRNSRGRERERARYLIYQPGSAVFALEKNAKTDRFLTEFRTGDCKEFVQSFKSSRHGVRTWLACSRSPPSQSANWRSR